MFHLQVTQHSANDSARHRAQLRLVETEKVLSSQQPAALCSGHAAAWQGARHCMAYNPGVSEGVGAQEIAPAVAPKGGFKVCRELVPDLGH